MGVASQAKRVKQRKRMEEEDGGSNGRQRTGNSPCPQVAARLMTMLWEGRSLTSKSSIAITDTR